MRTLIVTGVAAIGLGLGLGTASAQEPAPDDPSPVRPVQDLLGKVAPPVLGEIIGGLYG